MTRMRFSWLVRRLSALVALMGMVGCDSTTGPRERTLTIEVAESLVPCMLMFETTCLQIRERATDPWLALSTPIEGFSYAPGYRYMLRIRERAISNPPADGSSVSYRLISVLSKVAMPGTNP